MQYPIKTTITNYDIDSLTCPNLANQPLLLKWVLLFHPAVHETNRYSSFNYYQAKPVHIYIARLFKFRGPVPDETSVRWTWNLVTWFLTAVSRRHICRWL
jgi:hypothetical protein